MRGMPWLKLHTHYLDDPKLGSLPEAVQARYFKLYMLARQCDAAGVITHSPEEIAWKLHISLDELEQTFLQLEKSEMFRNNGKGPEIPAFMLEQITADQREDARLRKAKSRSRHNNVTVQSQPNRVIESESESESDIESDSKKEKEKNDVDDDLALTLKIINIPAKYRQRILMNKSITRSTILSAYTCALAQKKSGGKIEYPAGVAGWKLVSAEHVDAEWEDPARWQYYIPKAQAQKLGLSIQGQEEEEIPVDKSGYTKSYSPAQDESANATVIEIWDRVREELLRDQSPSTKLAGLLRLTAPISYQDGKLIIGASTEYGRAWMTGRMTSTVTRLLAGICNQDISVEFVHKESQ